MADRKQQARKTEWTWEPVWVVKETLRASRYDIVPDGAYKTGRARSKVLFYAGYQLLATYEGMGMTSKTGANYVVCRPVKAGAVDPAPVKMGLADVYA